MHSSLKRDIELLQKQYKLNTFQWTGKKDILKLKNEIKKSDITFSQFALDHAGVTVYFSKKYEKKSIVIIGGVDVAYEPSINYGYFLTQKGRIISKYILKNADKILVVDTSLKKQIEYMFCKSFNNIEYIATGYDYNYFKPFGKKEKIILTVSNIKKSNLYRKGLINFVKASLYFPDYKFVLVGKIMDNSIDILKQIAPYNVMFTDFVSDGKLLLYYQLAKIYCQFSKHEGLPNTLCESMLCNCIPIGSYENGIPKAIGNTGFYADYNDNEEIIEMINKAIKMKTNNNPRERIKRLFPIEKREKKLYSVIEGIL
jgi:glycosyltransferase involved in cell wall biosynthesis